MRGGALRGQRFKNLLRGVASGKGGKNLQVGGEARGRGKVNEYEYANIHGFPTSDWQSPQGKRRGKEGDLGAQRGCWMEPSPASLSLPLLTRDDEGVEVRGYAGSPIIT